MSLSNRLTSTRFLSVMAAVVLAFGLGIVVVNLQQQQVTQSRAFTDSKCAAAGGTCLSTSSACGGGFVDDYCPSQVENIKCCMPSTSACVQQLGGRCLTKTPTARFDKCPANSSWNSGNYCPGGDEVQCCVAPTNPTATATPKPSAPTLTPTITPTSAPGSTKVTLDLLMHGIGKAGDSVNPGANGGGNTNPLHKSRTVTVDIYGGTSTSQKLLSKTGTVTYDAQSGSFKGTVDMGTTLATGNYLVKVKLPQSLNTQIGNLQTITAGSTNVMPQQGLVTGDIANDNTVSLINVSDYNIFLGCYSTIKPPVSCTDEQKVQADLDDNGKVDDFDFNLFLRELTNLRS